MATFTYYNPHIDHDFTITGDYESIQPYYKGVQAEIAKQKHRLPFTSEKATTKPVRSSHGKPHVLKRWFVNWTLELKVASYDYANGTNFRQLLHEQRQNEKDLRMAAQLGLLAVEPCAKHRQALEDVQRLR
jgi:hypothetical protein